MMVLCIVGLSIYLLFGEQIVDRFQPEPAGLVLDDYGPDGAFNGHYNYPAEMGAVTVTFSVTRDGLATYQLEDDSEDVLEIILSDPNQASLTWSGVAMDGYGALSDHESATLSGLMAGDLAHALDIVPLDLGCQEQGTLTDQQLAALLFPLQMRFKYLVEERSGEINHLAMHSICNYSDTTNGKAPTLLSVSSAMPVPVVVGYFPFDDEGAVEITGLQNDYNRTASTSECPVIPAFNPAKNAIIPPNEIASILYTPFLQDDDDLEHHENEYGPCNSKCRGACGVDCTLTNCEWWEDWRCELDKQLNLTGYKYRWDVYKCGVHPGCVEHDACYDRCNQNYGCGTWRAAYCRHDTSWAGSSSLAPAATLSCDGVAISTYSLKTSLDWARGYGPFENKEIFEYQDKIRGRELDLELCPAVGTLTVTPQDLPDGRLNYPYFFKLEASNLPETVTAVRFAWDYGDEGSQDYPAEGSYYVDAKDGYASVEISHKYDLPGSYIMLVQLLDDTYSRDRLMVEDEVAIVIKPDATSVDINPRTVEGIAREPLTFTAQVNNPGDYRYDWTFGDQKVENGGSTISHVFENPGEYPVKVSLFGPDVLLDEDYGTAIIQPAPEPTPEEQLSETQLLELIINPDPPVVNSYTNFYLVAENLPANPSFDWDFGEPYFRSGGYTSYQLWTDTPEATWYYAEAGDFTITVLVRDKDNYPVILDTLTWYVTVLGKGD